MSLRLQLSKLFKRRRALRQSVFEAATSLKRLEVLAIQQRIDTLIAKSATNNPLLKNGFKVFSQNDEDGLIEGICRRLHLDKSSHFVEIGVGDGSENNTLHLLFQGWRGIWLGGEPLAFSKLSDRLTFLRCWVDQDNVAKLIESEMKAAGFDHIDLISLDIDGNDRHIAEAILENKLHPSIFVVEYNATMSPEVSWTMPYDAGHQWDGSAYFGASLSSFHGLFERHGYMLVACNITGANAFFVKKEFSKAFEDIPENWKSIYMPANYLPYPTGGHPHGQKFLKTVLAS